MELLGLFLIAFLVVLFPKQGLKAIGLCLGVCALLTVAFFGVLLLVKIDKDRQNAVFAAEWRAEQAQKVAKQQQEPSLDFDQSKADAQIEEEHQARMRKQYWEDKWAEERRADDADHMRNQSFGLPSLAEPLYVNPKVMPTPPPVSKPIPTRTPKKPETLYTSN